LLVTRQNSIFSFQKPGFLSHLNTCQNIKAACILRLMSQLSLNLIAILVFTMTLSALLGPIIHLSPTVPAVVTFTLLGLATLDAAVWNSRGADVVLDTLAITSKERRSRVVRHEAGHFLIAHHFNIPVTGYALTAWEAWRQGFPGRGGVQFDDEQVATEIATGMLSAQLLNRYCTLWMAGIAAELIEFENAEGGDDDRLRLRTVLSQLRPPITDFDRQERFAILQAKTLLQQQRSRYEKLVAAMEKRTPVAECYQILE